MGLGSEFFAMLKDTVKLTDAVERLNKSVTSLSTDVKDIDKRLVRIETMAEMSLNKKRIE